jgi:hypothetical protein
MTATIVRSGFYILAILGGEEEVNAISTKVPLIRLTSRIENGKLFDSGASIAVAGKSEANPNNR